MAKTILPRTNVVRSFHSGQAMPSSAIKLDSIPVSVERSERILLVEDEEETNLLLKEYLQSLGYSVIAASNGVEGLKEVMKSDFELIICDMMMPRLPGDMFYLAVQKTRPHLCNRFVFITGHEESQAIDAFIARTHAAILVKPFRLHQLEMTLESVLSRFPRKVQAVIPPTLKVIPNDKDVRINDQIVVQKHRQSFEEIPVKKEAIPSMVVKALKIVGFMRSNDKVVPPPLESIPSPVPVPQQQAPRITERIMDLPKTTRRIPELADKPIARPSPKPATDSATPRVTRRVEGVNDLVVRLPKPASTAKTTRTIQRAEKNVTVRVKNRETPVAKPASTTRVTRKIAAPQPDPAPKIAPQTAKVTLRVPKTTRKIAMPPSPVKVTPKVTQKVTAIVEKKKSPGVSPGKKLAGKK